jgi:hypothetical protein
MRHEVVKKKREGRRGDKGMVQGIVNAGVVTVRRAEGFVAGATPLLTGTLPGHPSNRTVYSGEKAPPHSAHHTRKRMV